MVRSKEDFPTEGEFVMARIVDIQHGQVWVDLIDYRGLPSEEFARGMIHVSEISSRWIKNIRNYVRINQIVVLRVLRVDTEKGHVDCSLRRVNSAQKENRKKEWKYAKKYETLLQFLADETELTLDEAYNKLGFPLLNQYYTYQETIEDLKESGINTLKKIKVSDEIKKKFIDIVDENVSISTVSIIGKIKLSFLDGNGVDHIKDTLMAVQNLVQPKISRYLHISYIGAPFYRLEIVTKDYIDAENILSDAQELIEASVAKYEGSYEFIRE